MKHDPLIKNPLIVMISDLEIGDRVIITFKHPKTGRNRKMKARVFSTDDNPNAKWIMDITFEVDGYFIQQTYDRTLDYLKLA
mgnify:CR=1 FL=1